MNEMCGAQYVDLFEPIDDAILQSKAADILTRLAFSQRGSLAMVRRLTGAKKWGATLEGKLDDLFYPDHAPLDLRVIKELSARRLICIRSDAGWFYPEDFSWLIPRPATARSIDDWIATFDSSTVGVHIRRGDHAKAIAWNPTDAFVTAIRKRLELRPETKFFLSTDDDSTRSAIVRDFDGSVMCQNRDTSRSSVAGVESAVIDLFCLAACSEIWGTRGSSFSETAHHLRKAPISYPAFVPFE